MQANSSPAISTALRKRLDSATRIFALTGAGISAESGVPTFRGGGQSAVWKGMPFSTISSAEMLESNLDEVWNWFEYRREALSGLKPNPAHEALAAWEARFAEVVVATQNVDGLHHKAGSGRILELHGNIWRARCIRCGESADLRKSNTGTDPRICTGCSGRMRPDVVLFGEMLPAGVLGEAAEYAQRSDVCFIIGTSGTVYPAAGLAHVAKETGAYVVEINPERTPLSEICDEVINVKASAIMPLL
jgi:NAD-dependent deacetylase